MNKFMGYIKRAITVRPVGIRTGDASEARYQTAMVNWEIEQAMLRVNEKQVFFQR